MGYVIAFVLGGNVGVLLMCLMFAASQHREEMELKNSHEKAESETEPDLFETGRLAGLLCMRDWMCRVKEKYTSENDAVGITLCDMFIELIDIELFRK